ncbi:hypothetical protein ACWDR3_43265 [Streptomyces sp. NPDC001002]
MAEEKDSPNGSSRQGSWDLVVFTVLLELAGLALAGIVALVGWAAFGWLPDAELVGFMAGMTAVGPGAERYGEGPRRRSALVAAALTLAAVTLLVAAAANWAVPALDDPDLGMLIGFLVGLPAGVAVLARLLDRAATA